MLAQYFYENKYYEVHHRKSFQSRKIKVILKLKFRNDEKKNLVGK